MKNKKGVEAFFTLHDDENKPGIFCLIDGKTPEDGNAAFARWLRTAGPATVGKLIKELLEAIVIRAQLDDDNGEKCVRKRMQDDILALVDDMERDGYGVLMRDAKARELRDRLLNIAKEDKGLDKHMII